MSLRAHVCCGRLVRTVCPVFARSSRAPEAFFQVLRALQDHRQDWVGGIQAGASTDVFNPPGVPCLAVEAGVVRCSSSLRQAPRPRQQHASPRARAAVQTSSTWYPLHQAVADQVVRPQRRACYLGGRRHHHAALPWCSGMGTCRHSRGEGCQQASPLGSVGSAKAQEEESQIVWAGMGLRVL